MKFDNNVQQFFLFTSFKLIYGNIRPVIKTMLIPCLRNLNQSQFQFGQPQCLKFIYFSQVLRRHIAQTILNKRGVTHLEFITHSETGICMDCLKKRAKLDFVQIPLRCHVIDINFALLFHHLKGNIYVFKKS